MAGIPEVPHSPEIPDIRSQVPADITNRLLPGEPVYYYATGSGCMGMGGKEWFALTDRRILMTTREESCLGMTKTTGSIDIGLDQIASVQSAVEKGCLSSGGAVVVTSTGATTGRAMVGTREEADRATGTVQRVLAEYRQRGRQ